MYRLYGIYVIYGMGIWGVSSHNRLGLGSWVYFYISTLFVYCCLYHPDIRFYRIVIMAFCVYVQIYIIGYLPTNMEYRTNYLPISPPRELP